MGWAVACGMFSFGENHVGVPGSDASGTRGAHAGTCIGDTDVVFGVGAGGCGAAAGPGAQAGRPGGPPCAGATGAGAGGAGAGGAAAATG